ncbi:MAG: radical SAM protein, partial [Clostridia bacterium]|nr:radical SAM protein [Clostridia bacterium]
MLDAFGREVSYLRVSLTQRCNLNCLYCGSEPPDPQELSPDATEKIVKAFVKVGINKVRLTGGEPLLRKDLALIASRLSGISGIRKLGITTNGVCLAEQALLLKEAGIDTVNISLDTIDRERYRRMTGVDALGKVLAGIDAALAAGFQHVRINSVLLRGENEEEAQNLILLAKDRT